MLLPVAALILASLFVKASPPLIVDTDAGVDDYLAIAFLLSRGDVHIEAVCLANGLAHVDAAARNITRLLALGGHGDVPVYMGRPTPMTGNIAFPDEWRRTSDQLSGVQLADAGRSTERTGAAEYLSHRLEDRNHPARILALGPLTNLAQALERSPAVAKNVTELVIMGGAVRKPGNIDDGDFKTDNTTAEWNFFVDPAAARIVFASGIPIRLIPLDATSKVPIDAKFLDEIQSSARTPLARFVAQVLASERDFVKQGFYYAWDPLAAVALVDRSVVSFTSLRLDIRQKAPESGRTVETSGKPNAEVAMDADAARFRSTFLGSLRSSRNRSRSRLIRCL
jgi:pyrimidine-specific ribonucleoside hydrolase